MYFLGKMLNESFILCVNSIQTFKTKPDQDTVVSIVSYDDIMYYKLPFLKPFPKCNLFRQLSVGTA